MDNITTTICVNGELKPGDLVLSTPADDYACLVGTVLSITKVGTPEHSAETDNPTDGVHVNFMDAGYSAERIREIDNMFSDLYREPKRFTECPVDDVIMSPDTLICITGINGDLMKAILDNREAAEALCNLVEMGPGVRSEIQPNAQAGYITEKLYSPLFCQLQDDENKEDYGGDYWSDPMSQQEAVYYEEEIRAAILRERMPDEEPRGLMTYYHDGDAVNEKVRSLFVDVEVHDGKLWGVATLELSEPLTPWEFATLKDYLTGQYSDGFGEGFEQRDIKIDRGELNVSLWSSEDEFFIDTEREFQQRLGLEPLEAETPAQAALHEPDIYDDAATAALREQLIERIDANLLSYIDDIHSDADLDITCMSSEIASVTGAHYYLSEIHNFHTSELQYLLQFQNPLTVVADSFQVAGMDDYSDVMWEIFDRQAALQGDYPLMKDAPATQNASERDSAITTGALLERIAKKHCHVETLETRKRDSLDFHDVSVWGLKSALEEAFQAGASRQREKSGAKKENPALDAETRREKLFERLDKNLSDYCESLLSTDKRELIGMAEEIAARYAAREYLKSCYDYKTGEVEYLLRFQDPLAVVADGWPGTLDGLVMDGVVTDILEDKGSHGHYAHVMDADSPAVKESARDASTEKRSVLEQIREAANAPREPHKDKPARDKSGPEL